MHEVQRPAPRLLTLANLIFAVGGAALALTIGRAGGYPTKASILTLIVIGALSALTIGLFRPYVGFLGIAASTSILAVVAITDVDYANAFDLLMPPLFAVGILGGGIRAARLADARLPGPAHATINQAAGRLIKSVKWYWALAALSIIPMAMRIGFAPAFDSLLHWGRSVQGVLVFPLAIWLLRSERRVKGVILAVLAGAVLFTLVNIIQVLVLGAARAGITWVINHPDWPVEGANEAGATMSIMVALIVAHHSLRPRMINYFMLVVVLFLLLLTQSRSGVLALLTFALFNIRRVRARYVVAAVILGVVVLAIAPDEWWSRMTRSASMHRGSFEAFTIWIRFYGFVTNLKMFFANPIIGYGWLGARYDSHMYNDLQIGMMGPENFYLETAVGMGVAGVVVMVFCFIRLFALGPAVRRVTPPDTLVHQMARLHPSLMAGLAVANLTGDNFVGLIGLSELAVWCAVLVRGGHIAIEQRSSA